MTWQNRAACKGDPPAAWSSDGGGLHDRLRRAIVRCGSCGVSAECAADALRAGDRTTIRCGLDLAAENRRTVLAKLRRAAAGGRPAGSIMSESGPWIDWRVPGDVRR